MHCYATRRTIKHALRWHSSPAWLTRRSTYASTPFQNYKPLGSGDSNPNERRKDGLPNLDKDIHLRHREIQDQAQAGLMVMMQDKNDWIRTSDDVLSLLEDMPINELQHASQEQVETLRNLVAEATTSVQAMRSDMELSKEHILDMIHEDFPQIQPYPYETYRMKWEKLTNSEIRRELAVVEAEIIHCDAQKEAYYENVKEILTRVLGSSEAFERRLAQEESRADFGDNHDVEDEIELHNSAVTDNSTASSSQDTGSTKTIDLLKPPQAKSIQDQLAALRKLAG